MARSQAVVVAQSRDARALILLVWFVALLSGIIGVGVAIVGESSAERQGGVLALVVGILLGIAALRWARTGIFEGTDALVVRTFGKVRRVPLSDVRAIGITSSSKVFVQTAQDRIYMRALMSPTPAEVVAGAEQLRARHPHIAVTDETWTEHLGEPSPATKVARVLVPVGASALFLAGRLHVGNIWLRLGAWGVLLIGTRLALRLATYGIKASERGITFGSGLHIRTLAWGDMRTIEPAAPETVLVTDMHGEAHQVRTRGDIDAIVLRIDELRREHTVSA